MTADRFVCFILTVKQSLAAFVATTKIVHPGDLARGCSDLEMTWLL